MTKINLSVLLAMLCVFASFHVNAQSEAPVITIETIMSANKEGRISLIGVTSDLEIDYGNGVRNQIKVSDEIPQDLGDVKDFTFTATVQNPVIKIYGTGVRLLYFRYPAQVKSIDLSNAGDLEVLDIDNVNYTDFSLDVTKCSKLTHLFAFGNKGLRTLDLSRNPELKVLQVQYTNLPELDLSHQAKLENINAFNTSITKLDFTKCPALKEVIAYECPALTEVNVSGCTQLSHLWVNSTPLQKLTFGNNLVLEDAQLGMNSNLSEADFSQAPKLHTLLLGVCAFTSLDLSACPEIETLEVQANKLTNLKIAKGMSPKKFFIFGNQLSVCCLDSIFDDLDIAPTPGTYVVARYNDGSNPALEKAKTKLATDKGYDVIDGITLESIVGDGTGCQSGGVYMLTNDENLKLSPNPTTGIINITSKKAVKSIVFYNTNGDQVVAFVNPGKRIDISHLAQGQYIALVEMEGNVYNSENIILNY